MKYHIEKNTVQETLVIPLYARLICSRHYPYLFTDPEAERICTMLDYDFADKQKKMESPVGLFGALEVAQRQYDLQWEVKYYLKSHPQAAVVNLGCGLDDTFRKCDNGLCHGYNIDLPDVIAIRNELIPAGEREVNLAFDLNDEAWMDAVDASNGAVFFASGVFYYFRTDQIRKLFVRMAERFGGAMLVFDTCGPLGTKMLRGTWLKEAGIDSLDTFFSLKDEHELIGWSDRFHSVTARSYMRGYRDIYSEVNIFHRLLIRFCDYPIRMKIVRIEFGG